MSEGVREARHHALGGELRLGRAEAAERATRDVVGVDGVAIHADVGDLVAAGGEERGDLRHLDAGGGIGAAVGDDLGLDGGDRAVLARAPAAAHADRMALVVADDRFLAAPDERDRAAQLPRGEREQMLDREVFASTERPADGGVADDHLLFGQLEHRGDLAAVLVQPLPGRLDDHAPCSST